MEIENACRSVLSGRVEIDTRPPFGSVKEAVALFGEKVLAGEIYATKLREEKKIHAKETNLTSRPQPKLRSLTLELEQTKQTLKRTLQLNTILSNRTKTLTQELQHERNEIQRLNMMRSSRLNNPEIEEFKLVDQHQTTTSTNVDKEVLTTELEKRRIVTFASSPLLTRVMSSVEVDKVERKDIKRNFSVKKTKLRRDFAPFIRWFRAIRGGD